MIKKAIAKIKQIFIPPAKVRVKFPDRGKGKMALVDIANVMAQIEGWNVAGSLAQRNNNPVNLRFANQPGATLGEGGFAKFSSPDAGFAAAENQISLDASRGLSVSDFINKFAPLSENNTSGYIGMFTSMLGVSSSDKLSSLISSDGIVEASNTGSDISNSLTDTITGIDPTSLGIGIVVVAGLLLLK